MKTLTHTMTVQIADAEVAVEMSFTCSPSIPERGPTYSSGGEPACAGEIEIASAVALIEVGKMPGAKQQRHDLPAWMIDILHNDEGVIEALAQAAQEEIDDAESYAAEMRADMRREEAA